MLRLIREGQSQHDPDIAHVQYSAIPKDAHHT